MSLATVSIQTSPENAVADLRFEEIALCLLEPIKKVLDLTTPQPWQTHFVAGQYKLTITGYGRPGTRLIVCIDEVQVLNFPIEGDGIIYLQKYFNLP